MPILFNNTDKIFKEIDKRISQLNLDGKEKNDNTSHKINKKENKEKKTYTLEDIQKAMDIIFNNEDLINYQKIITELNIKTHKELSEIEIVNAIINILELDSLFNNIETDFNIRKWLYDNLNRFIDKIPKKYHELKTYLEKTINKELLRKEYLVLNPEIVLEEAFKDLFYSEKDKENKNNQIK